MSKQNKQNQRLLQDITLMMTDPKQATNEKKIKDIMSRIRQLNIQRASDQLRLAACHFMTMFHTRKAMTIGMPQNPQQGGMPMQNMQGMDSINLKAVEKFKIEQRRDMELGWKLLNIKNSNSHAARTARVLKIEVAQRLEDSKKLKQAFEDLMKRNLTEEEIMVAFTAAPFLGDWQSMMQLGKRIEKMPGGLEQLHMMSLQLPIPDFTLVYDLVKFHKLHANKPPSTDSLKWELYNISKIRVKFKEVDCGEYEEKKKELEREIKKQGEVEWEEVPNCQHVHIKRMGALCQAVSFGEIPMMLNGPFFVDKIHVQGRAEMPLTPENQQNDPYNMQRMNPNDMTILVQEEEWFLMRSKTNKKLFKGIYTLKQRPELPPNKKKTSEHAPVNMTFECEIYIKDNIENDKQYTSNNNNKNEDTKEDDDDDDNNNNNNNENEDDDEEEEEEEEVEDDDLENDPYKQLIDSQLDDVINEELQTEFDGLQLD